MDPTGADIFDSSLVRTATDGRKAIDEIGWTNYHWSVATSFSPSMSRADMLCHAPELKITNNDMQETLCAQWFWVCSFPSVPHTMCLLTIFQSDTASTPCSSSSNRSSPHRQAMNSILHTPMHSPSESMSVCFLELYFGE